MKKKQQPKKNINKTKVKPDIVFIAKSDSVSTLPPTLVPSLTLQTDSLFKSYRISPGSPNFAEMGVDFAQKYDRLQKLIVVNETHANHDKDEIIMLDKYLCNLVIEHFRPPTESYSERNMKKILTSLAIELKLVKTQPSVILKLIEGVPVFQAMGLYGIPVKDNEGIRQFGIDKVDDLSGGKIAKIFDEITKDRNVDACKISFIFTISPINGEVVVKMYFNGKEDLKYGQKSIEYFNDKI